MTLCWQRLYTHTRLYHQVKELSTYSLLLSDMVVINTKDGSDVLTKLNKNLSDISYTINDESEEESDDEEVDAPAAPDGDAELARRVAKEANGGQRSSARLAKDANAMQEVQEGAAERERRQIALMTRRNEERLRELARSSRKGGKEDESAKAEELEAYVRSKDYPDNVQPNQVKVDMANQCVLLPICGTPVPFHISTIKNVVLPDPDNATYLRINFYSAGLAVGKDAPENTAKLVEKYAPYTSFIREMTFRSLDSHNLTQVSRFCRIMFKQCFGWCLDPMTTSAPIVILRHSVKLWSFGSVREPRSFASKKRLTSSNKKSLFEPRTSVFRVYPT